MYLENSAYQDVRCIKYWNNFKKSSHPSYSLCVNSFPVCLSVFKFFFYPVFDSIVKSVTAS